MSVDQRGTTTMPAVLDGLFTGCVALQRIGTVTFRGVKTRKRAGELGDAAAGGLHLNRDGNGVAVVFNQVKQGQFLSASGVKRFPEFALAGGAVARGGKND